MLWKNENRQQENKNTQIYMKSPRREKPWIEEKKFHYIKILV